eukprot:CAMPEP_0170184924 /NCGR_PEP_ID=MMETSP0040_2-20121228/35097_1 /TAXON_ID=641309 /ORGANISM="Lotharella oceanica, Strain CCMP622" /LENGTH=44 /DNA_ID= /DNA_START= /DNA_END= /DNA_ORIENTATION=
MAVVVSCLHRALGASEDVMTTTQSSSTSPALDRFYEVASESWDV